MERVPENPSEEYGHRLAALRTAEIRFTRQSNVLAGTKLGATVLTVIAAIVLAKYYPNYILVLFIPVAMIILLFVLHERTLQSLRRGTRLKKLYERGMERLEDRWAGTGETGERFLDPSHPYARDLDMFGKGGMFELLSTARTRAGEETLAAWLLSPAPVEEILARQIAVRELQPRLDFRENLALAGGNFQVGVKPEKLIAWSEGATEPNRFHLNSIFIRIIAPLLAALWLFSLLGWLILGWGTAALGISLVNLTISYRFRIHVKKALQEIEEATHDLHLLTAIFRSIETEKFKTKKLVDLQAILMPPGKISSSDAISRLSTRIDYLDSRRFVAPVDPFLLWTLQCVSAAETWRAKHGSKIRNWLTVVGEMEALTAFANYAYEHPEDPFPQFIAHGPCLHAEAFSHPLLPVSRAVANDLKLDDELQLLVISGPNMAGKSTFIRAVGVNVVLAQAGAPVRARKMVLSSLTVTASICILDSLQGGLSRFYAEITRLKQIDEQSRAEVPVLFLLDELLSGTNSHDRRVGTESFVRTLLSRGAIGLVTTHDLALAEIAEGMAGQAANFHFEDRFENGELRFDYRLTPGVVSTTNALKLMRSVGLEV